MKNRVKNIFIPAVILMIIIFLLLMVSIKFLFNIGSKIQEDANMQIIEMKSHIGDTTIIKEDTLIIIDYSIIDDTYTLSNGIKINKSFIK